jgi:hypothetical protein
VAERIKLSYEPGEDGQERPYLWLDLTTPQGPTIAVRGLVDSGADVSVLPAAYTEFLSLGAADLERVEGEGPGGRVTLLRAREPVEASLRGEASNPVLLRPLFVPGGVEARWGRDFMAEYGVAFDERARQFSLFSS